MPEQLPLGLHHAYARWVAPALADECIGLLDVSGRVLDVGSGSGELVSRLLSKGVDAVGVDADTAQVRISSRREPLFHVARAENLPFADAAFDAVVATESLHHWSDIGAAMEEIHRVLRPRGRLVVLEGRGRSTLKQVNQRLGLPTLGPARRLLRLIFRPNGMSREDATRIADVIEKSPFGACSVEPLGAWWRINATRS